MQCTDTNDIVDGSVKNASVLDGCNTASEISLDSCHWEG